MSEMWKKRPLGLAVSSVIAGYAVDAWSAEIETLIVTATKRSESAQEVPVAVHAVGGDALRELGIETFEQYADSLPNVSHAGNGPGKKEIFIRGTSTEQSSVTVSAHQGASPGVALYVDEQPVSLQSRNLDVYAVDLERIEVAAGPQGTLFGASSQSGNLRLITNKPDPSGFDAGFNATWSATKDGADSAATDAFVNLALTDALALRAVVYSDTQGGWIDNVPATFTPSAVVVDRNNVAGFGPPLAGADAVASVRNDALVRKDWNDATYRGGRVGIGYEIADGWDLLVQHTAQTLESAGTFLVDPSLHQEHTTARFSPEFNHDRFGLTAWTLEARIGKLDAVYTGGVLNRDVESVIDYTHYNNGGGYITYYLCSGNIYDAADVNNCYNPLKQYAEDTSNGRTIHEFRLSTDPAKRLRLLAGAYASNVETTHVGDFQYASTNPAFAQHISNYHNDDSGTGFLLGNTTVPTAGVNTAGPRSPFTTFFNDFTRTEEELAFFGEVAVDLGGAWSVALSARRYDLTTKLEGAANFSFGCRYGLPPEGFGNSETTADGRCNSHAFSNDVTARLAVLGEYRATGDEAVIRNARSPNGARDMFRGGGNNQATLDAIRNGHLDITGLEPDGAVRESDTIVRATMQWTPRDLALIYVAYAEGYRPATANRNAGQLSVNQTGVYENYVVPAVALTDHIATYEAGIKQDYLDGSLRLNAIWYRSEIQDLQVSRFDPTNVAFLYFVENAGDAQSSGVDIDFQWALAPSWFLAGAASFSRTELTRANPQLDGIGVPVGAELPLSPDLAGNVRLRYDFSLEGLGLGAHMQVRLAYRGSSVSGLVGNAEFMDDTQFRQSGRRSGLEIRHEGGTFGTIEIPDGTGGTRLPRNSRFVNPAATTVSMSIGIEGGGLGGGWRATCFFDNITNEPAPVAQVAGAYTPAITVQRPRTIGLRFSYEVD